MTQTHTDRWLRRWPPRPSARLQLICLPHAGGSASAFRAWSTALPDSVELLAVQYPGREDRFTDPMIDRMDVLVTQITDALAPVLRRPHVLFGHSMGSAVAVELAHELRRREVRGLRRVVASGRATPLRAARGDVHTHSDDGLCRELLRLGGTEPEILADPELRRAVLSYVRNDYRLVETWTPTPRPPLDCPVTAFTGTDDPELDEDEAQHWAALGRGTPDVETFPGGHFYLGPQRAHVVDALLRRMDPALVSAAPYPSTP